MGKEDDKGLKGSNMGSVPMWAEFIDPLESGGETASDFQYKETIRISPKQFRLYEFVIDEINKDDKFEGEYRLKKLKESKMSSRNRYKGNNLHVEIIGSVSTEILVRAIGNTQSALGSKIVGSKNTFDRQDEDTLRVVIREQLSLLNR